MWRTGELFCCRAEQSNKLAGSRKYFSIVLWANLIRACKYETFSCFPLRTQVYPPYSIYDESTGAWGGECLFPSDWSTETKGCKQAAQTSSCTGQVNKSSEEGFQQNEQIHDAKLHEATNRARRHAGVPACFLSAGFAQLADMRSSTDTGVAKRGEFEFDVVKLDDPPEIPPSLHVVIEYIIKSKSILYAHYIGETYDSILFGVGRELDMMCTW
eukprot:1153362-Pelagomonas_calceolata.AAC.2